MPLHPADEATDFGVVRQSALRDGKFRQRFLVIDFIGAQIYSPIIQGESHVRFR